MVKGHSQALVLLNVCIILWWWSMAAKDEGKEGVIKKTINKWNNQNIFNSRIEIFLGSTIFNYSYFYHELLLYVQLIL